MRAHFTLPRYLRQGVRVSLLTLGWSCCCSAPALGWQRLCMDLLSSVLSCAALAPFRTSLSLSSVFSQIHSNALGVSNRNRAAAQSRDGDTLGRCSICHLRFGAGFWKCPLLPPTKAYSVLQHYNFIWYSVFHSTCAQSALQYTNSNRKCTKQICLQTEELLSSVGKNDTSHNRAAIEMSLYWQSHSQFFPA